MDAVILTPEYHPEAPKVLEKMQKLCDYVKQLEPIAPSFDAREIKGNGVRLYIHMVNGSKH